MANGIQVRGIDLEARNDPRGDITVLVRAEDKRLPQPGSAALQASLTGIADKRPQLNLRGQLDRFHPLQRDDLDISLSGIFGAKGPLDNLQISGHIVVDEGELVLSTQLGSSVTTLDVVNRRRDGEIADKDRARAAEDAALFAALGSPNKNGAANSAEDEKQNARAGASGAPALDLRIEMPGWFYIRGLGLESEWEGELGISGKASAPSLEGSVRPVRGYLDLFSRTFLLSGGAISFAGGGGVNPSLGLEMTYEGPDITAFFRVSGTAKRPKLELDSRPSMPQDEILSHVLFGKRSSELTRFEAIQLANSLQQLTSLGGSTLDLLTNVRKSTGLDMLRIGGTQKGTQRTSSGQSGESNLTGMGGDDDGDGDGPALEAGKYINESIYLGVEQGVGEDSTAVRVEIELFPNVNLQGRSTTEASEVGVGWKMDY
ncbi:translocation/assembly module TamB [Desulfovibrio sp. OttesenSCG-928-A18]|nr:translocation/assembly module TamB [Desulfovibrio sp. OttesenSCG-928-A18]